MEPSFYSLFTRSRYLKDLVGNDDQESKIRQRKRREAERFAVMGIGFCLKHAGQAFREHFLKCIELPNFLLANERGIRVEDKRWGRSGSSQLGRLKGMRSRMQDPREIGAAPESRRKGFLGRRRLWDGDRADISRA